MNSLPSTVTICGSKRPRRASVLCARSFWRCWTSARSRASCSFVPRSFAISPRSASIWFDRSSRLRFKVSICSPCSPWRAFNCALF